MIEYIGFQPETAQKLWRTYSDAQKQTNGGLDLYAHAKTYLTRKFEGHKHRTSTRELLAAVGLSPNLVQSLIYLVQRISISQRFKLNKISLHDLRDWAIIKMKKNFYKMKFLDAQVLLNSPRSSGLGMFPLSLRKNVVSGQIVAVNGKPVADGFYIEKGGQLVPGWKASRGKGKDVIMPVVVANFGFAQVLPVLVQRRF